MYSIKTTKEKLDCCVEYVKNTPNATRRGLAAHLNLSECTICSLVKECKKNGLLKDIRIMHGPGKRYYLSIPDKDCKDTKNYLEGWAGAPILGSYNTKRIYEGLHDYA